MATESTTYETVWVSGYEKGRADGIALALAVLDMAIDYYPGELPPSGCYLLPGKSGELMARRVKNFGSRVSKTSMKEYKEWLKRKAEANEQAVPNDDSNKVEAQ